MKRIVRFLRNQGAEDLFFCPENRRIYIRQPAGNQVLWLTTSKWFGGYEASSPLKDDVVIEVVDDKMAVLYSEHNENEMFAKKTFPFSYEWLRDEATKERELCSLETHQEWKQWLLATKPNDVDNDNWLYCYPKKTNQTVIGKQKLFGVLPVVLVMTDYIQEDVNKEWREYAFFEDEPTFSNCLEIVGYKKRKEG